MKDKFQESRSKLQFAALLCKVVDYRKREKKIEPPSQMRFTNWARVGIGLNYPLLRCQYGRFH